MHHRLVGLPEEVMASGSVALGQLEDLLVPSSRY